MSGPRYRIEINPQALQKLGAGGFDGPRAALLAEAGARIVADSVKDVMEEAPPRTGREYLVPGTKTPYTASAPGEPPAIREGLYAAGWEATKGTVVGKRAVAFAVNAVATEDGISIGAMLEDGTSRMAPRPHIREGINRARPLIEDLIRGGGQ
ncbi:MAG TPA: hypothetical protein VLH75_20485 [Longimicrobiales bacterium]|nr:hypothetical protein [Longimicrobiales bacterium]